MEKWEYITRFVPANKDNFMAKESIDFYNQEYGEVRETFSPRSYSPQYMIGILNNMGEQGWELVHMEPVPGVGGNHDIKFSYGGTGSPIGAICTSVLSSAGSKDKSAIGNSRGIPGHKLMDSV